jgi:hypothetical protein
MKTLSIILIVIGLAAWMRPIAYADPSGENTAVPKEQPTIARRFNDFNYPHLSDHNMSSPSHPSQALEIAQESAVASAPRSGAMPVAVGLQPTVVSHHDAQRRVATPDTNRSPSSRPNGLGTTAIGGPATPLKSTVAITGQSAKAKGASATLNGNTLGRKH